MAAALLTLAITAEQLRVRGPLPAHLLVGSQGPGLGLAATWVGRSHGDAAQRGLYRSRALTVLFRSGRLMCQAARTAAVAAQNATATAAAAVAASNGATNGSGDAAAAAAAARPLKTGVSCLLVGNECAAAVAGRPAQLCSRCTCSMPRRMRVAARGKFWVAASQLLPAVAAACPEASGSDPGTTGALRQQQQPAGKQQQQQQLQSGSAGGGSDGAGALPEELELLGFRAPTLQASLACESPVLCWGLCAVSNVLFCAVCQLALRCAICQDHQGPSAPCL